MQNTKIIYLYLFILEVKYDLYISLWDSPIDASMYSV